MRKISQKHTKNTFYMSKLLEKNKKLFDLCFVLTTWSLFYVKQAKAEMIIKPASARLSARFHCVSEDRWGETQVLCL